MPLTATLGDIGSRVAPGRGILRRAVARVLAQREAHAERTLRAHLLGYDDAMLATFGFDRVAIEEVGRRPFPL